MKTVTDLRPKKVRILGREYDIKYTPDIVELGLCYTDKCQIKIRDDQHPVEEADTVLHEVMHGLCALMNLNLSDEVEEHVVRKLATGLTQVFMDNPHLVTYLANAGPPPRRR
ncbi:hypothetical protein bb8_p34 [Bordetella phage vB_BbrP_BB8]|uniref:Uncharacterized protein n=1 Tax=Bordetella phage vB_BbrP_BB8 TaxID=2587820 RepID=A0A4Y5TPQ8_9CAUD|nr:hypothetical protein bb8_p34 [Bordetella phage vB_BbrP_BB8]